MRFKIVGNLLSDPEIDVEKSNKILNILKFLFKEDLKLRANTLYGKIFPKYLDLSSSMHTLENFTQELERENQILENIVQAFETEKGQAPSSRKWNLWWVSTQPTIEIDLQKIIKEKTPPYREIPYLSPTEFDKQREKIDKDIFKFKHQKENENKSQKRGKLSTSQSFFATLKKPTQESRFKDLRTELTNEIDMLKTISPDLLEHFAYGFRQGDINIIAEYFSQPKNNVARFINRTPEIYLEDQHTTITNLFLYLDSFFKYYKAYMDYLQTRMEKVKDKLYRQSPSLIEKNLAFMNNKDIDIWDYYLKNNLLEEWIFIDGIKILKKTFRNNSEQENIFKQKIIDYINDLPKIRALTLDKIPSDIDSLETKAKEFLQFKIACEAMAMRRPMPGIQELSELAEKHYLRHVKKTLGVSKALKIRERSFKRGQGIIY